jgi:SAM-dependent methyltransferase
MSSTFHSDLTGYKTLEAFSDATAFNFWMFNAISPFIKGNVIEIGSGIGNMSQHLIQSCGSLYVTDLNDTYCDLLRRKFSGNTKLKGVAGMDLTDPLFAARFKHLIGSFDTVVALNVVEHIENDDVAILNASSLLKKDGYLVILVPAYPRLYNRLDKELNHYRRYTKDSLTYLVQKHMPVIHGRYFNAAGLGGWFLSGSVLKHRIIASDQIRLFNRLVPAFRVIDRLLFNKVGLSVIVAGRKG